MLRRIVVVLTIVGMGLVAAPALAVTLDNAPGNCTTGTFVGQYGVGVGAQSGDLSDVQVVACGYDGYSGHEVNVRTVDGGYPGEVRRSAEAGACRYDDPTPQTDEYTCVNAGGTPDVRHSGDTVNAALLPSVCLDTYWAGWSGCGSAVVVGYVSGPGDGTTTVDGAAYVCEEQIVTAFSCYSDDSVLSLLDQLGLVHQADLHLEKLTLNWG